MDEISLLQELKECRMQNKLVVFTNGVFDILHPGHIHFLMKAASKGDVLVVGINSDDSVRKLKKNYDRPINSARDRMFMLNALKCVNFVIIFEEKTPLRLIKRIMPNILVKGKDWEDKGVVGRDIVESNGGMVITLDLLRGYSTTCLIERCWKAFNKKTE